jgi:hypothetical protein
MGHGTKTRQPRQENRNRTARTGKPEKAVGILKPGPETEQDGQNMTARAHNPGGTTVERQPRSNIWDSTTRTGQETGLERSA